MQGAWNCTKIGLLIFPLIPALGSFGLLLSLLLTWKNKYALILRSPLNWGWALLSFWLVITACFSFERTEAFLGLANFLPFFAFFAAFSVLIQTTAQLRQLAWVLVISSLPVIILALGQHFLGWASPEQLKGSSAAVFGSEFPKGGNPPGRIASVFMYANILAAYLQIILILGLGLLIESFQAWRKNPDKLLGRVFILLSALLVGNIVALFLTSSRNGWAIAVLAFLSFALYLGWRWLVVGVTTFTASVLWASFGPRLGRSWLRGLVPSYLWLRLSDQLYPDRPVELMRTTQWQFAWKKTLESPWIGWGLRNFPPLYQAKRQIWLGHPHNLFLMLMVETGIPATFIFCCLVGWILAQAILLLGVWSAATATGNRHQWYKDKLILFTYLVAFASCTIFNLLDVTVFDLRVNTLGWLLLSAVCGVVYHYRGIVVGQRFEQELNENLTNN